MPSKKNAASVICFRTSGNTSDSAAGYNVQHDKQSNAITIHYHRKCDVFRALGRILGQSQNRHLNLAETTSFDTIGLMLDVSRNGVMHTDALEKFMVHTALMGINFLMLYTEDTFEIPSEPMFGYMRGRYTHDELKNLDDIAHALGIELCPCIQTLGHLTQVLQRSAIRKYGETENILMPRDEKTFDFIQRMIDAASAPFRSKRIHLGMDEAYGLGTGRFLTEHGHFKPLDLFLEHLSSVSKLCVKRGLSPMIWSDMLFRGPSYHGAYNLDVLVPKDAASRMPPDIQPVF